MKIVSDKAVYIQVKDLLILKELGIEMPEFLTKVAEVCANMPDRFTIVSDPNSIRFIKEKDFFVDYFTTNSKNATEMAQELDQLYKDIQLLNTMKCSGKGDELNIYRALTILRRKREVVTEIYENKYNNKKLNLPLIPDENDEVFDIDGYFLQRSIDKNHFIAYKKDNSKVDENISSILLLIACSLLSGSVNYEDDYIPNIEKSQNEKFAVISLKKREITRN